MKARRRIGGGRQAGAAISGLVLALGTAIAALAVLERGPGVVADGGWALFVSGLALGAGALGLKLTRRASDAEGREAELARVTWRLEFALRASDIGVWDVDLETDRLIWDERARAIFGAREDKEHFNETDWLKAVHPEDREAARAAAHDAVKLGGRFVQDYRVQHPDGSIRHVRDMAQVYESEDGRDHLVGLVWDVTADMERQAELDLRRLEAEAATVTKSNFLAAMSHEIRTPLTGVLGMLDLMLDEPLPEAQRERGRVARESARGLLTLLNDILDFSKLEAEEVRLRREPLDPRMLVQEVTALMSASARRKGLVLRCTVADEMPQAVMGDALRLRQVLTNIVSNAINFTEEGEVVVRADHAAGKLRVSVSDTGAGIPAALIDRIFERFVQADATASRKTGGTGLGLAIVRHLVTLMEGHVEVSSVEGEGSVFTIEIPAEPTCQGTARQPSDRGETQACSGLRVLVAEDNATNQHLIHAFLLRDGHVVTLVDDGEAAVRLAASGAAFDVILMDVQMPTLDGPSAARAIRALPGPIADVPIIALTASVLSGARESYLAAGMNDHVGKPIVLDELRRALAAVVPAPQEECGRRSA